MISAPEIRYCLLISKFVEVQVIFFTKLTSDLPCVVMSNDPVVKKLSCKEFGRLHENVEVGAREVCTHLFQ